MSSQADYHRQQLRDFGNIGVAVLSLSRQQYLADVLRGALEGAITASKLDPLEFIGFLLSPSGEDLRGNIVAQVLGANATQVQVDTVHVADRRP